MACIRVADRMSLSRKPQQQIVGMSITCVALTYLTEWFVSDTGKGLAKENRRDLMPTAVLYGEAWEAAPEAGAKS